MKRFFDLSLLLLIPLFLISNLSNTEVTTDPEVYIISDQAEAIYARIDGQIEVTLEEIQDGLNTLKNSEMVYAGSCELSCHPVLPDCCYGTSHLDRLIIVFGCCPATETCLYPCLDLNGDGCINTSDLLIILSNYCG